MFKAPNPKDFNEKPDLEMKRRDGSIMRVYKHKTESGRHRVTVDDKPYDPTSNYVDAIEKGLIKKK